MSGLVSLRNRLQVVDLVHIGGLAAAAIAVVAVRHPVDFGAGILALNLALIASVVYLAHGPLFRASPRQAAAWRVAISYAVVITLFNEMGSVIPAVNDARYGEALLRLDIEYFALDPVTSFERVSHPALGELFAVTYFSFYLIPLAFFIVLYRKGFLAEMEVGTAAVVLGFYVSYIGHAVFPALSPFRIVEPETPLAGLLLFDSIHLLVDEYELHKLSAFPSGHILVALIVVLLCALWRLAALPLFLIWTGLLWLATLYLRFHYLIDTLVSVPLAPLCVALAFYLRRWLVRREFRAGDVLSN